MFFSLQSLGIFSSIDFIHLVLRRIHTVHLAALTAACAVFNVFFLIPANESTFFNERFSLLRGFALAAPPSYLAHADFSHQWTFPDLLYWSFTQSFKAVIQFRYSALTAMVIAHLKENLVALNFVLAS